MCERKCSNDFSGWGKGNYTPRYNECTEDCPRCINDMCVRLASPFSQSIKNRKRRSGSREDYYNEDESSLCTTEWKTENLNKTWTPQLTKTMKAHHLIMCKLAILKEEGFKLGLIIGRIPN